MADQTIPGLPNAGTLTGTEYVPISQSAQSVKTTLALIRAYVTGTGLAVQSGTLANRPAAGTAGRVYLVTDGGERLTYDDGAAWVPLTPISGDISDEDASGNPTPDSVNFPAANYDEGQILIASSFTTPIVGDTFLGGDMTFQLQSGAWVWIQGSYRASNSNGEYERRADGRQVCTVAFDNTSLTPTTTTQQALTIYRYSQSWTFPAAFSVAPRVWPGGRITSTVGLDSAVVDNAPTTTTVTLLISSLANSATQLRIQGLAIGKWK